MRRAATSLLLGLGLLVYFSVPAFANPGDLDGSFGTGGLVRSDITPKNDTAIGVAVQGNGKIVVVGTGSAPNTKFLVARYNTDGTPDSSFGGGDGKLSTDLSTYRDIGIAVAIQGDGKIVVVGGVAENGPNAKWGVVRYKADGTLDDTFGGGDGITIIDVSKKFDEPTGVGFQSTGRIIVSGGAAADGTNPDFAVAGLTTAGALDSGFATGGIVRTDFSGTSYDWGQGGLVIQPDDRIVVGGYTVDQSASTNPFMAMARYTSAGALDTTFSGDGKLSVDFGIHWDYISNMALDGTSIVAAGEVGTDAPNPKAGLLRVTSAGVPDTTFNGTGKVATDYGPNEDFAGGVAVDGDGNIVTGGGVGLGGTNPRFAVCRYLDNGTLDTTFGGTGKVFTDLSSVTDYANNVAIGGDGNVVAIGVTGGGSGNSKFGLARYLSA